MTRPESGQRDGHGPKVLVSAASKYGATAEIAQAIANVLTDHGIATTVMPPPQVDGGTIESYDAVILGSAVYTGHWLGAAKDLVARSDGPLAARPVWLFSSGPVGDPAGKFARAMEKDPVDLADVRAATAARDHRMFRGKLDRKNLSPPQRAALMAFRSLQGDFRDWAEISRWAEGIAQQLAVLSPR